MRRKNFSFIWKLEEFLVQASVEHRGKVLRGVLTGKIGAADISNKQGVSRKHGSGLGRLVEVSHRDTDALGGVTGSGKKIEPALTELEGITVFDCGMRESSAGTLAEINAGSGALGKLMMTGDKVGVQVRFDDVLDLQTLLSGVVKVDVNVALGIDYRRDSLGPDQIGSVRQTSQKEMFHQNRCHIFLM